MGEWSICKFLTKRTEELQFVVFERGQWSTPIYAKISDIFTINLNEVKSEKQTAASKIFDF